MAQVGPGTSSHVLAEVLAMLGGTGQLVRWEPWIQTFHDEMKGNP